MFGRRPFAAECVETSDRFLRSGVPHEREDWCPVDSRPDLGHGQAASVRHGVHDDRFGEDFRAARTEAVAGGMDLVDVVSALHLQDAGTENTVRDGVLMHRGPLEKADRVFRQRRLRHRESFHGRGQIGFERRRGLSRSARDQCAGQDCPRRQQEPEDFAFHDVVGKYENGADRRAKDCRTELQEQRRLRLNQEVSAHQERGTRASKRKCPERRNRPPGGFPAAEKPNARPPEPGPCHDSDHVDLLHHSCCVKNCCRCRRQQREPVKLALLHGIHNRGRAACRYQQKGQEKDPVQAVHGR